MYICSHHFFSDFRAFKYYTSTSYYCNYTTPLISSCTSLIHDSYIPSSYMLILSRLLSDCSHNSTSQRATLSFEQNLHSMILWNLRFNRCSPIEPCIHDNTNT